MDDEKLLLILKNKKLKPSYQRIKILGYLASHPCHPSADAIYNEIHKEIPTISRSTIYSTLKSFLEAGILHEIKIEDSKARYEYTLKDNLGEHGHFYCESCGEIYDFGINFYTIRPVELEGFTIKERDVFLKGICQKCTQKNN